MGLIEQLVPFVRFGQLISFLPYRIERNSVTVEARFKFSCCHPLTIWFILGLSFQCLPLVTSIISINYFQGEFDKVQMPFLLNLLFIVVAMFHNLTIFVSRGIHLRYHKLRSVIDLLTANVVVKLEEFESFPACSNNLKMKTLFGILVILVAAMVRVIISWASMLEDLIKNSSGPFIVIAFFGSNFLSFIINDCLILLIYLCYYTIARHIRLLRVRLIYNSTSVEPWKGCKKVLIILSKASAALESAFSLPILYTIASKLVTVSLYLFTTIYGLLRPNSLFATTSALVSLIEVVYSLIIVLCVFRAADLPVNQIRQFREEVIRMANNQLHDDVNANLKVMSLLQHADEERFRLSAAGMFHVGMHLLPPVTGSIITYLVILLQYQFN